MRPLPRHDYPADRSQRLPLAATSRRDAGQARRRVGRTLGAVAVAAALFFGGTQPASASLLNLNLDLGLGNGKGLGKALEDFPGKGKGLGKGLEDHPGKGKGLGKGLSDPEEDEETVSADVPAAETASAAAYWTLERMRLALPGDALTADSIPDASLLDVVTDRGESLLIAGDGPVALGASDPAPEAETQSDGATAETTSSATAETPVSHIGKVFFTMDGSDYVCSGNAVVSGNESTVSTAGHCVHDGPGSFASRFIFVPAYENGATPYGKWAATELHTTPQWANDGDLTYDGGFAVVAPLDGATLTDTVGSSGVAFNQSRGLTYTAYGYPAGSPYDGETLQSCYGTASDDPHGQTESQGIDCDMTGGSSGGPWFIGSGSDGYQNSVNSFRYSDTEKMFGPYFGTEIQNVYQDAQN